VLKEIFEKPVALWTALKSWVFNPRLAGWIRPSQSTVTSVVLCYKMIRGPWLKCFGLGTSKNREMYVGVDLTEVSLQMIVCHILKTMDVHQESGK